MKKRFVILLCVPVSMLIAQQMTISFDASYSASWFKKASDTCINAWGDLQQTDVHNLFLDQYSIVAECTLGRLAYAYWCLQRMQQARIYISAEDQQHFIYVCNKLTAAWNQQPLFLDSDYTECFQHLVRNCMDTILCPQNATILAPETLEIP